MIGISNDETNFPRKLLLTIRKFQKIREAFANGSSANIKFSKTRLSKLQSLGFNIFNLMNPASVVYKTANKAKNISNKVSNIWRF